MEDTVARFLENMVGRIDGPMHIRLVMQPLMALIFAARAGIRDARTGRPPYFWTMCTTRSGRSQLLREGWQDVGKVFIAAFLIDVVYQIVATRWVYPGESLSVATILAFFPYVLFRGPCTRIARLTGVGARPAQTHAA